MVEQEIAMKMPKGTSAALSIKEVDGDGVEVSCQGSVAGIACIIISAMEHPVIMVSILTAVGVYFDDNGKEIEALIIGQEIGRSKADFDAKIQQATGEKEEVEA